jgi:glycosyltransferase involved in cell wall biosynthesis
MTISIITPTFNSARTLEDTLQCIATQDYPHIEHIIVDGQSKDNTLEVVKSFPHVSKVISEPDQGVYDAMNKGIRAATGDIVGILNSDDFYAETDILARVADLFQKHKTDSLYGDLQYVDDQNPEKVIRYWRAGHFNRRKFLYGWMPPHPTFFLRREIYERYGLFDLRLRSAADYELMLRYLFKQRISAHYLPMLMVNMRTGGMSNASFRHRLRANREDRLAWKLNGLEPHFFTTMMKPLRKVTQYWVR